MESIQTIRSSKTALQEIINLTKAFIQVADDLYEKNKITEPEYIELTYFKRNFLQQIEKDNN